MAIDLSNVMVDIAGSTVSETNDISATLTALEDLNKFATDIMSSGETFINYEAAIQERFSHLDGAKLNQFLGIIIPSLLAWLSAQVVTGGAYDGATYYEMLHKVRSA